MIRNFAKQVLQGGGQITPLLISPRDSNGLGLLNPSIFIDKNDEPWCILRNVNYTEYHTENHQIYNNRWGPLSYLNPENDLHLRTWNFLCKLDKNLAIERYWKIDTSALDKEPLWDFVGLEDARLVRWDGKLYEIGVRRDTTPNGQGRMEFSELEYDEKFNRVKEVARFRVEHPVNPDWYCEKNWMPIIDMPYHFVKYTNPVEVVTCDLFAPLLPNGMVKSWRPRDVDESQFVPDLPFLRGGSQVIPWRNLRICLVHEVDLRKNYLDQKDATYRHRFVAWDLDWNLINITDTVSFMGGELEFACGAAIWQDDLIVGFSVQDNCAFHLRIPATMIPWALGIDQIDWGHFSKSPKSRDYLCREVIDTDIYQRKFKVEEGDKVLDVGASIGPFIWRIADQKPERVIAVEPDQRAIKTLKRNCAATGMNIKIIEKGISSDNGKMFTMGLFDGKHFCNDTYEGELSEIDGITFKTLIEQCGLDRIDFLKTDSEGAEYDIFNDENLDWIKTNVKRIAGEFHLHNKDFNRKWLHFRDTYLKVFPAFSVDSADGVCITDSVWSAWFAENYKCVTVYIDNSPKVKWQLANWPSIEITTMLPIHGCPMRCSVCPQDALAVYNGVQTLSYENFVSLINKVPKEILVSFAGYAEPFLNPGCAAMVHHAHDTGRKVSLWTTAVGMKQSDLDMIRDIPFVGIQGGFVLHLPDKEGYLAEDNWRVKPELFGTMKEISGFESMTMGTLPDHLREIFPDTIKRPLYSRAGNVDRDDVIQTDTKPLSTCGCQERLYHNVLLPNGDVTLCCMDYGLKNILGNLHESNYEDIVPVYGMPFELCRHCENGIPV